MNQAAPPAPHDWHQLKEWLEHAIGLNMDALHVYFGVAILVLAALILRRPLRSPIPWLVLLALELANEYYDWTYEVWPGPDRAIQAAEGLRDIWNTMALPTFLLVVSRWFPGLYTGWRRRRGSGADAGEAGGEAR
ncbi:MAG: hypothetical protein JO013_02680 [Alphaproteobacteria bacterium]|nr:hypothetical protein [Alphaproteobacteria bacterium]